MKNTSCEQEYISEVLCHFVGRGCDEKQQFDILKKIIKEKVLKFDPSGIMPNATTMFSTESFEQFGEITHVPAVCFCDIPMSQLNIHCLKYSKFGLSFKKEHLLSTGIRPVWYIPKNSYSAIARNEKIMDRFPNEMNRVLNCLDITSKKLNENTDIVGPMNTVTNDKELQESLINAPQSFFFLLGELFWYFKFYDASLSDEDKNNYYFEREWRKVNGNIDFEYSELENIFVPNEQFKNDFSSVFPDLKNIIYVI